MNDQEQIKALRDALSIARPFVVSIAELPSGWGQQAKRAVAKVDDALIQTDSDPIVRDLLGR